MSAIKPLAEQVRANRQPVGADNPLLAAEKQASSLITAALENGGEIRDAMTEAFFLTTYGSPLVQAMVGLGAPGDQPPPRNERDLRAGGRAGGNCRVGLDRKFEEGGVEEAVLRALIYVRRPDGGFDERGYRMLKAIRETRKSNERLSIPRFREMLNEQLQLVLLDEERAIAALAETPAGRRAGPRARRWARCASSSARAGPLTPEGERRFARVEKLFGAKPTKARKGDG